MTTPESNDSSSGEIKEIEAKLSDLEISDSESDDTVKAKPRVESTASDQNVLIHVINIGQGDSILVELGEYTIT